MLITAALLILMLTVYLLKNFITLQTCKYTFSYSMYYYIIKKYEQSCLAVLGVGDCDVPFILHFKHDRNTSRATDKSLEGPSVFY